MERFMVIGTKCEVVSGGPDMAMVLSEVEAVNSEGEHSFFSIAEVDGIPSFFKTKESTFELQKMDPDEIDEDEWNSKVVDNELAIDGYEGFYEECRDEEWYDLVRYLICVVRSDWDETGELMKEAEGKFVDELVISASDVEEDYM